MTAPQQDATPVSAHDHGNCELCDSIERELEAAREEIEGMWKDADEDVRVFHKIGNELRARAEKAEREAAIYKRDCESAEQVCANLQSKLDAVRAAIDRAAGEGGE